jgi:outer membrane protein OmpA-like peptidoglycan-associated protein
MENAETVSRNFNSDANAEVGKTKIINSYGSTTTTNAAVVDENSNELTISFNPKSFSIVGETTKTLDKLVAMLKKSPTTKISIAGYFDASEKDIEKLDTKRVMSIYKYIVSKGIKADMIERSTEGMGTDKDILKNTIVRIEILRESALEE